MTDLDYIHKAIIESKGCEGGDFPYEYACPDDFSVTIQPEDWGYHHSEVWAYIEMNIPVISPILISTFKCNDEIGYNGETYIPSPWDSELSVILRILNGKIIRVDVGDSNSQLSNTPLTLNFTDLLFIGNKKE